MTAWLAPLLVSVYLFGFVVTGRWWARRMDTEKEGLLDAALAGMVWPVLLPILGFVWLVRLLLS